MNKLFFASILLVFFTHFAEAQCVSQITFSPNDTICVGQPATISLTNAGVTSVTWSGGDLASPQSSASINVAPTSTKIYIVNWTSGTCTVTDSVRLIVTPVRAVFQNKTNPSCGQNNGAINCSAAGTSMVFTYFRNGVFYSDGATQVSNLPSGNYTFVVYDRITGCSDTADNIVLTDNTSFPSFSSIQTTGVACYGNTNGSISVAVTGGTGNYTYTWSHSSTNHTNTATGLTSGTVYTVTVDDGSCLPIDTSISLSGPSDSLRVSLVSMNDNCQQSVGKSLASVTGGTTPYQYVWANSSVTADSLTGILGPVRVNVTVTDVNGCSAIATDSILNTGSPSFQITDVDSTCGGGTQGGITITPFSNDGPFSYVWSFGSTTTQGTVSGLAAGTYTVSAYNSLNCAQILSIIVPEYQGSTFDLGGNQDMLLGGVAAIEIQTDAGISSVQWSPLGVSTSGDGVYYVSPSDTTTYYVTATYGAGCTLTDSIIINVIHTADSLEIPNIFTPNGDGTNDEFYVKHHGVKSFQLWIYDRWGNLIYRTTEVDFRWSGEDMRTNTLMSDGNYAYMAEYSFLQNPSLQRKKGFISLIK